MRNQRIVINLSLLFICFMQTHVSAIDGGNYKSTGELNHCTARHECSFVQAGESFYLMGGRETNQIEQFNFATKTWTGKATAPIGIHHFQALDFGGLIWAVCGMTGGYPAEPNLPNVYMYDPVQNIWIKGVGVPAARQRGSSGVVMYKNEFYIVSGNNHGHDCGGQYWTDKYNPATNTWTILKDGPRKRDHFFAMLYKDKIYSVGGRHSSYSCAGGTFGNTHKEVDIYDIPTDTWTTLSTLDFLDRAAPITGILGNEIVVLGGEHATYSGVTLYKGQALDLTTHIWRTLTSLPKSGDAIGRHATEGVVSNGVLWAAAGSPNSGGGKTTAFFGYYTDNANAGNLPAGTPIVAGAFSFSSTRLSFSDSANTIRKKPVILTHTSGNQGIVITNIAINQKGFTLTNTNGFPWFLAPNCSLRIEVAYNPAEYASPATMTIITVVPGSKLYTVTLEKGNATQTIQHNQPVKNTAIEPWSMVKVYSVNGRLISSNSNSGNDGLQKTSSSNASGLKAIQVLSRTGQVQIIKKSINQ